MDLLESINLEESLKVATPYMLRNDGVLLECGQLHPYIIYDISEDVEINLEKSFTKRKNMIVWFYNNTKDKHTKELIEVLVNSLSKSNVDYIDLDWVYENFDIDEHTKYSIKEADYLAIYQELNNLTNQEFLRMRTSSLKFGGDNGELYFRVSSNNFNWYPLIAELVMKNSNFVEDITITNDPQSKGGRLKTYRIGFKQISHMSVEDFIMLKGNPVIENYKGDLLSNATKDLQKGKSLEEAFNGIHPVYINEYYEHLDKDWIKNNYE